MIPKQDLRDQLGVHRAPIEGKWARWVMIQVGIWARLKSETGSTTDWYMYCLGYQCTSARGARNMGEPPSFGGTAVIKEMTQSLRALRLENHFGKQICSTRPSVSLWPTSVTSRDVLSISLLGLIVLIDMHRLCPWTMQRGPCSDRCPAPKISSDCIWASSAKTHLLSEHT